MGGVSPGWQLLRKRAASNRLGRGKTTAIKARPWQPGSAGWIVAPRQTEKCRGIIGKAFASFQITDFGPV